jgi:hypothetical protein
MVIVITLIANSGQTTLHYIPNGASTGWRVLDCWPVTGTFWLPSEGCRGVPGVPRVVLDVITEALADC